MTCVAQTDGLHEEQVEVTNSPAADPGALQDVPSVWLQCPMIERVHDPVIIERIARNEEGLWSAAIGWRVFFEGFGPDEETFASPVMLDGGPHRDARKLLQPAFGAAALTTNVETMRAMVEPVIDGWAREGRVPFKAAIRRLWCQLQTPYALDEHGETYRCAPNYGYGSGADGCYLDAPGGPQIVDCPCSRCAKAAPARARPPAASPARATRSPSTSRSPVIAATDPCDSATCTISISRGSDGHPQCAPRSSRAKTQTRKDANEGRMAEGIALRRPSRHS